MLLKVNEVIRCFTTTLIFAGTGEVIEMTEEQMQEWLKCSQDIFHFSTYFYINADGGSAPIVLRPYQRKIVETLVANVPRQK